MAFWKRLTKKEMSPQEMLKAGDLKGALSSYVNRIDQKGFDPTTAVQIADIFLKLGKKADALSWYIRTGEYYGDRGFFNKSVAAFKKALKIEPDHQGVLTKLTSYNEKVPKYMLQDTGIAPHSTVDETGGQGATPETDDAPSRETEPPAARRVMPEVDEDLPLAGPFTPGEAPDELEADAEPHPEAVGMEPAPATQPPDQPQAMGTDQDDMDRSQDIAPIDPDTFWDDEIDFESTTREAVQEVALPSPPLPAESETEPPHQEDPTGLEALLTPTTTPPPPRTEDIPAKPSSDAAVFKKRGARETEPVAREPVPMDSDFASFEDAIDNLFTVNAKSTKPSNHEQNRQHWPVFRTMPADVFLDYVKALDSRTYDPGQMIVQEGEPGEEMFLIVDGEVEVTRQLKNRSVRLAVLQSGDFFGEGSLLTMGPRNATVQALKPTEVLLMSRTQFGRLSRAHPSVLETIERVFLARSRQRPDRVSAT